jgi:predicted PP-loop superfamily ATPase
MDDPRFAELFEHLRAYEALAVAFSGGADSTLLLAAARDALCAERIIALTAVTPYMVRPTQRRNLGSPTNGLGDPSDRKANFLGQVNRIYGRRDGQVPDGGLKGDYGFIVE